MERDTIFKTSLKKVGIFDFKDFYKFCYQWVVEEIGNWTTFSEDKYSEKIKPKGKEIDVEWNGTKKITDYFRFDIKVVFEVKYLNEIEIVEKGKKIKTNEGEVKLKVEGYLVRDYDGKFEKTASLKFLRSLYEKWVIKSRVDQFEGKVFGDCNEFLSQAKAWLDLESK